MIMKKVWNKLVVNKAQNKVGIRAALTSYVGSNQKYKKFM